MREINIQAPLVYQIGHKESKRHSKLHKTYVYEFVEVAVRELDDDEAPVAARFKKFMQGPDDIVTLRTFDGRLFKEEYESRWSGDPRQFLTREELREFSLAGKTYCNPLLSGLNANGYDDYLRGRVKQESDFAIVAESNRAELLAKLKQKADALLLVDGRTWVQVSEPVYVVRPYYDRSHHFDADIRFSSELDQPLTKKSIAYSNIFSIANFDDADAFFQATRNARVDPNVRAEVFIPEVFSTDWETPAVIELLTSAVDMQWHHARQATPELLVAWANFRDASQKAAKTRYPEAIQAALHKAALFADAPEADGSAVDLVNQALSRWECKATSANLTFSASRASYGL